MRCALSVCVLFLVLHVFISTGFAQPLQFTPAGLSHSDGTTASLAESKTPYGPGVEVTFNLVEGGWANLSAPLRDPTNQRPVTFLFIVTAPCTLELKFVTDDGSTFGQRVAVEPTKQFRRITIYYTHEVEFWWGDSQALEKPTNFEIAVSGAIGTGKLTIVDAGIGKLGAPSSFGPPQISTDQPALLHIPYHGPLLDPDRNLAGFGVRQRRAKDMIPEDPLVLEWLKLMQDTGTPDGKLLPSTPGGDEVHTFNNVLAAMAFIRHGERQRAERILDCFRDAAADTNNSDPTAQSFYLNGEARGFYQRVSLRGDDTVAPMHASGDVDRWMGDMAWMMFALLDYQKTFKSDRYEDLANKVGDLLQSWFTVDPNGHGGYVQHGWRKGDSKLHEESGHHEGNIDCYALFMLLGERELAQQIRKWLDSELAGRNDLPLDLYTWRVCAFNGQHAELLDIPDFDLRFRKKVEFNGRPVIGMFSSCNAKVKNIWTEGAAHMSCAYAASRNLPRSNFYANQLDAAIIEQHIGGKLTHSLPYALNGEGGYEWVKQDEGFVSTAAWYIFAKHRFNPLRLKSAD